MKNIELKIFLDDTEKLVPILREIDAQHKGVLHQIDNYYWCSSGRLKLRCINDKEYELIFYTRPDSLSGKISDYHIFRIDKKHIRKTKAMLTKTFGKLVTVEKRRSLWMYKNTRIHLDKVKHLGTFLELETVVKRDNIKKAKKEYTEMMKLLSLSRYKKERKSYSDLLLKKHNTLQQSKQKTNPPKDVMVFLKNKLA